ncbi:3-isopropylmalate dehydratase small subunit [Saccharothrix sp. ALI-22-I]|uniref:3-isopropylmalate dehydratase small subunit n=1 Tax=Saccharothrix sp. ALI-22-I TaxID=1933778 RepID=UPI00097BCAE6|nr:3-isopropylmalate dehydratase small subunit [Saccharothrix sp. ALI-22-I]ONI88910.1 3-isopropylmalate dehydratase small subunit [Saccharothrix sp. ALI-22-I]
MRPISGHTGTGIPLRRSGVDTDQIIPSGFCRSLRKTGYQDALFATWRVDPDFVLNDPERADASVLVTGPDFGTGSSREHAVWALRDWGIGAVIAPSFGDIFWRNALRNGLLAVRVPEQATTALLDLSEAEPWTPITVDLVGQQVRASDVVADFEIDADARQRLLLGRDEIELTLGKDDLIKAYERGRPRWLPRLGQDLVRADSHD